MSTKQSTPQTSDGPGRYDFVVVANRLPVDASLDENGELTWKRSPGGLVSALAPLMRSGDGAWVGWPGSTNEDLQPFEADGMRLWPVRLTQSELGEYYEGFSNATLWPLYHDVIVPPEYHREWWTTYNEVNQRFADAAAAAADDGATVWVHDYQLQLVPAMLRKMRPDLRIGFFNHIPFPPVELFGQLPWRAPVVEGLLGADLVGFQRTGDAANFVRAVQRFSPHSTRGRVVNVGPNLTADGEATMPTREVRAGTFGISIDAAHIDELARSESVQQRAAEIRSELGDPEVVLLGVDRLDYTKGIRHRFKTFGEMLTEEMVTVPEVALVQVASPSRERVEQYQALRHQIEETVGHINGEFGSLAGSAIYYLHHSYPIEEMAALFQAADVMLVTALRDGMNLVAKEYIAARHDLDGVLVLSEFAGAADELTQAVLINPHDIEATKAAIMRAIQMPATQRRRRMRSLRRRVLDNDVSAWAKKFLSALQDMPGPRS
ncbi:MAG TPA: trehalose-6-phosphate synthase [Beutenbergiaceae bacterium]|nr:trehalose-6-phosphate synthase [Beutenbergiaceae bacterium]